MSESRCFRCGRDVDVQNEEWWQYSWEENPSKENVEKAIEDMEFRDWFKENQIICKVCHDRIQEVIDNG